MNKKLLIFKSPLHDQTSVLAVRKPMLNALQSMDIEVVEATAHPHFQPDDGVVCFIGTGGTEEVFEQCYQSLPQPIILLGDGYHNSFAASFEIATFLQQHGIAHRLLNIPLNCNNFDFMGELYSSTENVQNKAVSALLEAKDLYAHSVVRNKLQQAVIGLIGGSSSWLISSQVDTHYVSQLTGATFVNIPIQEVEQTYKALLQDVTLSLDNQDVARLNQRSTQDLQCAEIMYRALKAICEKYALTALTLKCFDLLNSCQTTACYALAKLNDEGIIAGCEGDIPALWTMIVVSALTGQAPFMANPSSSNSTDKTIDFAHCTIPFRMLKTYTLPSHFESGIGIGIAGQLPEGKYNIMKIGGEHLDQLFTCSGRIICNTHIAERCRTQVRFEFQNTEDFSRFLSNRTGNHIILYPSLC